jgi:hypothetical protein
MTNDTTNAPAVPRRSPLMPTIGLSLWLIFVLVLSLSQWRLVMINADGDPSLHWRIGQWMIEHRAVIRADHFSHARVEAPLISKEWLGEVLFAAAGDALGWNGIVLLSAVLIATSLWFLHRLLLAEGNDLVVSTALTLLAAMTCSVHWLARPHLFTHLFAVIFLWQLRLFDRGKLSTRALLLRLAPLMVLWANLHGAFFTGFVIIATFLAGNAAMLFNGHPGARLAVRSKLAGLTLLAVVCTLATLLNPNGWRLAAHVIEFLRDPILARYTNEFRSPNFHTNGVHGFLVELALVALMLVLLRPVLDATDVVVVGTWGLLGLLAARNVPIFAIMVTPILAQHLTLCLQEPRDLALLKRYWKICGNVSEVNRRADGRCLVGIVLVMLLLVVAKPRLVGGEPILATELLTNRFPVAAVQFLQQTSSPVHGEMFNDYGWGGYLMLALPAHKVFVDGRNDFYGSELIHDFDTVNRAHPGWDDVLQKYKVGWTILPRAHPLNELLALRKDWSLSYTDAVTAIYSHHLE